jgi:ribose 5-phosphate isomerase B
MKVAIGSDHRGFQVKRKVVEFIERLGHEAIDLGTSTEGTVDYPDFALEVGNAISQGRVDRGILICGTGIGMSMAANKIRGVRAALCHDDVTAEMSRRHNDANVMCLSADLLGDRIIERMIEKWLSTEFEGGRHARRVDKIRRIENGEGNCG